MRVVIQAPGVSMQYRGHAQFTRQAFVIKAEGFDDGRSTLQQQTVDLGRVSFGHGAQLERQRKGHHKIIHR